MRPGDHRGEGETVTESDMPLILVRGFGGVGVGDEQANAYQGFNNGTVYPGRRGENFIYEGFVLRALKSPAYPHHDATNVVGYYAKDVVGEPSPGEWYSDLVDGAIVVAPGMARQILKEGVGGTVWIYRYYDLQPREIQRCLATTGTTRPATRRGRHQRTPRAELRGLRARPGW